jgi:hypothetical protein
VSFVIFLTGLYQLHGCFHLFFWVLGYLFWFAFIVYEYLITAQAAFKNLEERRHIASYEAGCEESRLLMQSHGDNLEGNMVDDDMRTRFPESKM